jgi:hypothetical protein
MQPPNDREPSHTNRAITNGAPRVPHPTVPTADFDRSPDRVADLVTRMVDVLVELYGQPTENVPHIAGDDPRLRAAITRLHRLEGSLEELTAEAAAVHQLPLTVRSAVSGDRGEWVAAGMRH